MNRFDRIEETAANIRDGVISDIRGHTLLFKLCELIELLTETGDPLLFEATFSEFVPQFIRELSGYNAEGNEPATTLRLIKCAGKINPTDTDDPDNPRLESSIKRLKKELKLQKLILAGNSRPGRKQLPNFPVIETVEGNYSRCLLDSIRVVIRPATTVDKFIIHPVTGNKDPQLEDQIKTCYQFARRTVEIGKSRLPRYFEVQIDLLSGLGAYSGRSFGALLALLFVIELRKRLHPNRRFGLRADISVTGGIDDEGVLLPTGKKAIELKTKAVFYSFSSSFILPEQDFEHAQAVLSRLQKKYPARKLELIPVGNIHEVINRRDIFRVAKKPVKQRVKEWARKYRYGVVVFLPVIMLLGFLFARVLDKNPVGYELVEGGLAIKNKYGSLLWMFQLYKDANSQLHQSDLKPYCLIVDVNGDGGNEILISSRLLPSNSIDDMKFLTCLDKDQNILWRFSLTDTISSPKESNIPATYDVSIYDTVSIDGRMELLVWANSIPTFPAALFTINPVTGKQSSEILWNSGHIQQVGLADIDGDNIKDLIFNAVDNGTLYNKIIAVNFPISEGTLESNTKYTLSRKRIEIPKLELHLPVPDCIELLTTNRWDIFFNRCLTVDGAGKIAFESRLSARIAERIYMLSLDSKTHEVDYFINHFFELKRDSLVNAGKLPLPYTDTKEYTDILKNGVRYKLDGKWVTYQEYVKAGKIKALVTKKK